MAAGDATISTSHNMLPTQREALAGLRADINVIAKPADKNLGLTLMSRAWYDEECLRQLSDTEVYTRVQSVDVEGIQREAFKAISHIEGSVTKQELKFLRKQTASCKEVPSFYVIPKLHKTPVVGRPIVASHSWVTTPLAVWAAYYLNLVVNMCCLSVLESSHALISGLDGLRSRIAASTTFMTADVESLYTNIPINPAITAMIGLLKRNNHAKRVALTRVVSFVLHNNFLTFNGCFWRQRSGIAMGTPLAPPLANLYMYTLETEVLSSFEASKFFYRRYLDDILVVFFGNEGQAAHMQQALSNMKPHIRLKFVKSCFQVDFLDFVIGKHTCHVTGGASLFYRVHQKALNKYLYISPFSYHPPHGMKAFIKTELVRYVRHSSCHYDFLVIARRFFARLRERGFNPSFLRPVFDDVNYALRADKLILAPPGQVMIPLVFKLCFEPRANAADIVGILKHMYEKSPQSFRQLFQRVLVSWSSSSNIYKRIVRANTSL